MWVRRVDRFSIISVTKPELGLELEVVAEMTTVMGFIHQREDIKNNILK